MRHAMSTDADHTSLIWLKERAPTSGILSPNDVELMPLCGGFWPIGVYQDWFWLENQGVYLEFG
jgi:hypothetical protein